MKEKKDVVYCMMGRRIGAVDWIDVNTDVPLLRLHADGRKEDLRQEAPYLQLLPCPWCGVSENARHDPLKHVHPEFGVKV